MNDEELVFVSRQLLMEVLFGVQRQSPGEGLGAKPPAAERFFFFRE